MSLLDLLAAGKIDEFNASRGQRRRVELFAADLAEAALAGVDLSNANLEKSDLTSADLTDANLSKADLSGIDASEAKFCDAMGVGCKMREAYLDAADLSGADFSHGDLSECVLTNTQGPHLRLNNTKLREIDATGASWHEADLSEARLHKANLTKADLTGADLTEANLTEANLTEAVLKGVIAQRARFQQAVLHRASLVDARLEEANLQGADLTGADLERADLRRANLSGAILTDCKLRGAVLADAVLDGVDLAGLDLADVDLTGVDPRAVGLTEEQLGSVAAVGAAADATAPLRFTDVSLARRDGTAAILWENADTEETLSLRWALVGPGRKPATGILPVSAEGVLARAVAATDTGFVLLVLQERPGGTALLRWDLGASGEVGTARVESLGYEPGVRPVVRVDDGRILVWGLARRGPTLVVQKLGDEGLETVHSERLATARGFLGGHDAVLACKGGVVIPVGPTGAGGPLRTPSTFPGRLPVAVQHEDKVLVVWVEDAKGDDEPGGIRTAWLGPGVTPKTEVLTTGGEIASLDAIATPTGAWISWSALGGDLGDGVFCARVPGGTPERIEIDVDIDEVRFANEARGQGGLPVLALATFDEGLVVVDLDGRVIAVFEGGAT